MVIDQNLVKLIETSIKTKWDSPALSDYEGEGYSYGEVGRWILWLHAGFETLGIKKGDKVALLGKNSAHWAIVYLATISYGAVIVPILPDFKADDVHHIVNHSDAVALFVSETMYENLDPSKMEKVQAVFSLERFEILSVPDESDLAKKFADRKVEFRETVDRELTRERFALPAQIDNRDMAAIVYTSGTSGFSKGVMLSYNSLTANVLFAQNNIPLEPGGSILSFLPLAHSYGCAFEFLYPFTLGCQITFLGKTPSPKVILKAFGEVRPRLVLSVPLVIEKIYKNRIAPALNKKTIRILLGAPGIKKLIYSKVRRQLVESFGGNFIEIIIGGAPLNPEVEAFLKRIGFPFTIGYGMTECGPLISYSSWKEHRDGSAGRIINYLEIRIDSDDPYNTVGEIMVRGENVMDGYYKNEEATREALTGDGWLRTGDQGVIDRDGFVYIRGRSKNMILGPSGQNIYPEEIEAALNNLPFILESLVLEKNGQLVALVYPDQEKVDAAGLTDDQLSAAMERNCRAANGHLPAYSRVSKIQLVTEAFVKTPTQKIKRFLYEA